MTETVNNALRRAASRLSKAGVATPDRDVRRLMAHVLDVEMAELSARGSDILPDRINKAFETIIERREGREPVSHLVGYRDFWTSRFKVTPDVLDPRPETETLVACALEGSFERVLELGVGSGAVLISLLLERPGARGVGTDISAEAVLIAGQNAEALGVADRITLPLSDWFDDVGGRYDLIVSNPPYIAASEMAALAPEVRQFEPRSALTDEQDGLSAYRKIAERASQFMNTNGRVLVEIGPTQAAEVVSLFTEAGFSEVRIHKDFDGRDRVVEAGKGVKTS